MAVGGYGRSELAPWSDLDLLLVGDDDIELGPGAERIWYPLWDSGARLDHSVRTSGEVLDVAEKDLRVALGLLDIRHLAGDSNLTLRVRTQVLTQWRRTARDRLPELRRMVDSRHALMGELAHVSVPDLKEAEGGLRDATVLKALVATWLVDVPHVDLERVAPGAARRTRRPARGLRAVRRTGSHPMPGPSWHPASGSMTRPPSSDTCVCSAGGSPTSRG